MVGNIKGKIMNRRGFFGAVGAVGAAAAATVLSANTNEILQKPIEYTRTIVPHENLRGEIINDPDLLISNKYLTFDVDKKIFNLTAPATMQAVYSAAKWRWKMDRALAMYAFPFVALTPEMFQAQDGWTAGHEAIKNIRTAGLAILTEGYEIDKEYAGIELLSQTGIVFGLGTETIANGGLVEIVDGKMQGHYQKHPGAEIEVLQDVVEKCIGTYEMTYIHYRIV